MTTAYAPQALQHTSSHAAHSVATNPEKRERLFDGPALTLSVGAGVSVVISMIAGLVISSL